MFTPPIKARLIMAACATQLFGTQLLTTGCGSKSDEELDDKADESDETASDTSTPSDDTSETSGGTRWTGSVCPPNNPPTYENFGQAFMADHCTRCHSKELTGLQRNGATPNYDFDTLNGIKVRLDYIDMMAAAGPKKTNTVMPPGGGGPSGAQRERLGEWLACLLDEAE